MVFNETLMQFQSDVLGVPVIRPKVAETTALGAAYAAGLGGRASGRRSTTFVPTGRRTRSGRPSSTPPGATREYKMWKKAVTRTFDWVEAEERELVHA